jgi:hypothetical protein
MSFFYGMLKKPTSMKRETSWAKFTFLHHVSPASLLDDCAGKIAGELCRKSQEFFPVSMPFHRGCPHSYITWGMKASFRDNLTPST